MHGSWHLQPSIVLVTSLAVTLQAKWRTTRAACPCLRPTLD